MKTASIFLFIITFVLTILHIFTFLSLGGGDGSGLMFMVTTVPVNAVLILLCVLLLHIKFLTADIFDTTSMSIIKNSKKYLFLGLLISYYAILFNYLINIFQVGLGGISYFFSEHFAFSIFCIFVFFIPINIFLLRHLGPISRFIVLLPALYIQVYVLGLFSCIQTAFLHNHYEIYADCNPLSLISSMVTNVDTLKFLPFFVLPLIVLIYIFNKLKVSDPQNNTAS